MPLALFYHPPEEDLGSKALLKQIAYWNTCTVHKCARYHLKSEKN